MSQYRSAAAFESKGYVYFETVWSTTVGVGLAGEPVFSVPIADRAALSRAIHDSLAGSTKIVPHPTDWKAVKRPIYDITPFKTHRAMMNAVKGVSIMEHDGIVEFDPYRNEGPRGGFTSDGKAVVRRALDADGLVDGLFEALALATYVNGKTTPT